ncbi:MAG: DUF5050 domain-containing protein, partial [Caldisericia bacterium]|nr:DUF5050 domain-containing protein [Caldisericia bacterium]
MKKFVQIGLVIALMMMTFATTGNLIAKEDGLVFGEEVIVYRGDEVFGLGISDNFILWVDDNGGNLWSYDITTGEKVVLGSGGFDSFFGMPNFGSSCVDESYIVCSGNPFGDNLGLRLIKLDGTDSRKLSDSRAMSQFIKDGFVYYNGKNKDGKGVIYKYNIETRENVELIEKDDYISRFYMTQNYLVIPVGFFTGATIEIYDTDGIFMHKIEYLDDDTEDDVRKSLMSWGASGGYVNFVQKDQNTTEKTIDVKNFVYNIKDDEEFEIVGMGGNIGNHNKYSDKIFARQTGGRNKDGEFQTTLYVLDPEKKKAFKAEEFVGKLTEGKKTVTEYVCSWENMVTFTE